MKAQADAAIGLELAEVGRLDLRTSRSGDAATASLQRALGLQYRYQPARLAIARSLGLPKEPPPAENLDGKPIRGEQLFGLLPEEIGLWMTLLAARQAGALAGRRSLQEMVAAHWARGAALLWDGLRSSSDAPLALATQLLRQRR